MRIGNGYDVHKLTENRKLILGGVNIEYGKGLLGHSDADVLVHAIIDALLGAAALGDLGKNFPDTNDSYKDISSLILLDTVARVLRDKKFRIENIDSIIVAQKPKLAPYIEEMQKNISKTLKIPQDRVSVKATTEEGLGFTGTGKGIAAYAVCLIEETE